MENNSNRRKEQNRPRSRPDRRLIVTTIKRDRGVFWSKFEVKFTDNSGASKAPKGIAPMTLTNRLHDRSNDPRSSSQFPSLKACISLFCSGTFDRFVKELSEFQGRSLVHREPPAFRLDCDAIGAGLIANSSLISSNFPLEFRTSARKNPSKFASIHEN